MKGLNANQKSERVIVHMRIRPFTEDELKIDNSTPIESVDTVGNKIVVKKEFEKKNFSFDTIFPQNIPQKDIFEKTSKSVVDVY